jgi:hypothetical protein
MSSINLLSEKYAGQDEQVCSDQAKILLLIELWDQTTGKEERQW